MQRKQRRPLEFGSFWTDKNGTIHSVSNGMKHSTSAPALMEAISVATQTVKDKDTPNQPAKSSPH